MKLTAWIIILTLWASGAWAQQDGLLERSFSGTSKEKTPMAARVDIQNQAARQISEEVIKELIGEKRFARHRALIASKIIKDSRHYIPFSKPSELAGSSEDYKMSVMMKISLKDLKQMLQDNSLLSENDSAPVVIPLIVWNDRVQGRSYRWWQAGQSDNVFLLKEARRLEKALRSGFLKNGFYLIEASAAGLGQNLPTDFQSEKITPDDAQFFALYYNAPLLVDGQVLLEKNKENKYNIEIRLTAVQVSNGRTIADVSRKFETDKGSFESAVDKKINDVSDAVANDLASQVLEAWQRGSIGTSVIRVTLKGKSSLPMVENFKTQIRTHITQVRNIRERLITSEMSSFEMDTSISSGELLTKLLALNVDGKKLKAVSQENNEVILSWTP